MQKIEATSPEAQSADITAENIAKLKALFPEVFTEGKDGAAINVDVLKGLVGAVVTDADEKYGLNWHGKRRARQLALTPSTGTLRPCPEESVDWNTTQNLMIEGDNLEVLKLLQKSYANQVNLIYIDPPYNTGKDFVYPDNFQDSIKNYLELTGQIEGGAKISSNTDASGRFHTDWLNMMYPRLQLARSFLKPDGILLASIDDTEVQHLRLLLDSVFGPENFEAMLVWEGGRKNDSRRVSVGHDYILVYARDSSVLQALDVRWRERKTGLDEVYQKAEEIRKAHPDNDTAASKALQDWFKSLPEGSLAKAHSHYKMLDKKGVWYGDNMSSPNPRANLTFEWKGYAPPANGWRYDRDSMSRLDSEGLLLYPESKDHRIQYKRYLHLTETGSPASVFYRDRRAASKSLASLMEADVFDFPKDVGVLARLINTMTGPTDVVMDFFAGSGSIGHAVMSQNASDSSTRRFVLVQLPEPVSTEDSDQKAAAEFCKSHELAETIAELTKERLRRAGRSVRLENPEWSGDVGFRVFKLDSSNIRAWSTKPDDLEKSLLDHLEHLDAGRTEADLLYELLLKLGLDLCVPIEHKSIAGKTVHSVGGGVLMACLDTSITVADAEPLALGIVAWHQQQAPAGDTTCVFRDSAFADDVAKSNLAAILEQHGIARVRSL
jgi:adenine-specific DNA-methyltransferase